jgi:hypothetical protein
MQQWAGFSDKLFDRYEGLKLVTWPHAASRVVVVVVVVCARRGPGVRVTVPGRSSGVNLMNQFRQ